MCCCDEQLDCCTRVRRYWARGIAVVQHVSGAGADCWLRGMSAAKALTLLTLL